MGRKKETAESEQSHVGQYPMAVTYVNGQYATYLRRAVRIRSGSSTVSVAFSAVPEKWTFAVEAPTGWKVSSPAWVRLRADFPRRVKIRMPFFSVIST